MVLHMHACACRAQMRKIWHVFACICVDLHICAYVHICMSFICVCVFVSARVWYEVGMGLCVGCVWGVCGAVCRVVACVM